MHPFQAIDVGIEGFIPRWVLMTKRSDNFLRETPVKRVLLGPIVDPQDSDKSDEVGVVPGEVPAALFELLQLPGCGTLLIRVAKDAGDLGEECSCIGEIDAIRGDKRLHSHVSIPF